MIKKPAPIYCGRTSFPEGIFAEFWMPRKPSAKAFIIVDGCPTVPGKHTLAEFLAKKGYWVFHIRYRGSWESKGQFLKDSPDEDIRIVALSMNKGFANIYDGKTYFLDVREINVIGASFGGAAAILASRYLEINKAIAFAPMIDWQHYNKNSKEESFAKFLAEVRGGFGDAYRGPDKLFKKLENGKFFNPVSKVKEIDGGKLFLAHAKDDTVIPFEPTVKFGKVLGIKPLIMGKGGHLSSRLATKSEIWKKVNAFLKK